MGQDDGCKRGKGGQRLTGGQMLTRDQGSGSRVVDRTVEDIGGQ